MSPMKVAAMRVQRTHQYKIQIKQNHITHCGVKGGIASGQTIQSITDRKALATYE